MADRPPAANADQRLESTARPRPRTPRWVLVLGIIGVVLIAALVVSTLSGVNHGPQQHSPSGALVSPPAVSLA